MDSWIILIPVGLGALLFLYGVGTYNRIVRARNHCDEAWSNVDTELKRRYDLIPNLVAVVRGYADHERATLERVTELRAQCIANTGPPDHQAATENRLVGMLGPLLARVENYPDLKADQHFRELHDELVNTEDRLQAARRFYNGNVREYRNLLEMFPSSVIAGLGTFHYRAFFEIEDLRAFKAPAVALDTAEDSR